MHANPRADPIGIPSNAGRLKTITIRATSSADTSKFEEFEITVWKDSPVSGKVSGSTLSEWSNARKGLGKLLVLNEIRKEIIEKTKEFADEYFGGDRSDGTQANAFQHALYFCELAKVFDEDFARKWGHAHEDGASHGAAHAVMDVHNNEIGIELSKIKGNCEDQVKKALFDGKLIYRKTPGASSANCDDYLRL